MKKFLANISANFSMITALIAVPLVAAAGLSIDYSNAVRLKSELQHAADAAVLAAASVNTAPKSERRGLANKVFKSNFTGNSSGKKFRGNLKILKDGYRYSASGEVETVFMHLIGRDYTKVSVIAEVGRNEKDVEVALVLDTTGSMAPHMAEVKAAAEKFVDTIFDASAGSVKMAVVPFVASVNVGKYLRRSELDLNGDSAYNAAFLEGQVIFREAGLCSRQADPDGGSTKEGAALGSPLGMFAGIGYELLGIGKAHAGTGGAYIGLFPSGWTSTSPCVYSSPGKLSNWDFYRQTGMRWKGCVEARPGDFDISDEPARAGNPDSLWVPYFWPDEEPRGDPAVTHNHYFADDYWDARPTTEVYYYSFRKTLNPIKYDGRFNFNIDETPPETLGPNKSCPDEVLPLESSRDTIKRKIEKLNFWNDGGTIASEGVAWAMRMLTPEPPFTEAQAPSDKVKKIIVLFGDGRNSMPVNIDNSPMITDYGAYGYASWGRFRHDGVLDDIYNFPSGPDRIAKIEEVTQEYLDERMAAACEYAKGKSVSVMTILFNEDDAKTQALYRDCASNAQQALIAGNSAAMQDAFDAVAGEILKVYLRK